MKRGFIITFSTILIVSSLLLFSQFYLKNSKSREQSILMSAKFSKLGLVLDDIENDVEEILGTTVAINKAATQTEITFTDKLPSDLNKFYLLDYRGFLYNTYAPKQNISLIADFNELLDNKTELIFSNGLQYDYFYGGDNIVGFYVPGGDTNATTYNIIINVNNDLNTVQMSGTLGTDINVNLYYTDNSNTINESWQLDANVNNQYTVYYTDPAINPNDYLRINVGNIGGYLRAIRITESIDDESSEANLTLEVIVPAVQDNLFYWYNADLNYSQADVNANGKIVIGAA